MSQLTSERVGLYAVVADSGRCRRLESKLRERRSSLHLTTDTDPSSLTPERIVSLYDCLLLGTTFGERTALALVRGVRDHDETFPVVVTSAGGVESRELDDRADAVVERSVGSDYYQRLGRRIDLAVATSDSDSAPSRPGLEDVREDLHYVLGPDGRLEDWNDTLPAVTGYDEATLSAIDPLLLFVSEDRHAVRDAIGRCLGSGSAGVTARLETDTGGTPRFEFRAVSVTDSTGRPQQLCGVARDVETGVPSAETLETRHRRLQMAATDSARTSVLSD